MLGIWLTFWYHVSGVRPLGLYLPSNTSASASPLRMPLNELHRIAGVVDSKDETSCGPIVSITPIVFGFAVATWLISCRRDSGRVDRRAAVGCVRAGACEPLHVVNLRRRVDRLDRRLDTCVRRDLVGLAGRALDRGIAAHVEVRVIGV